MNEDPLTVSLTQISQLVATLNKKNLAQSSRQIYQVNKEKIHLNAIRPSTNNNIYCRPFCQLL